MDDPFDHNEFTGYDFISVTDYVIFYHEIQLLFTDNEIVSMFMDL